MAVNAILSCLVGMQPQPFLLQPRVVEASIFKDGLCYLVREIALKPGRHTYRIEKLPDAYDGTLWYQTEQGTAISSLRTKLSLKAKPKTAPARTRDEFLVANVGKTVKMTLTNGKAVEGKILAVVLTEERNVTVALTNGSTKFLPIAQVSEIDTKGVPSTLKVEERSTSLGLEFEAVTSSPAKMQIITLERGAAWASSYWLRLEGEDRAVLEGKAQLAMASLSLANANVQVLTGYPAIAAPNRFDLAVGYGSLNSYLTGNQAQYEDYRNGDIDPYTLLPNYASRPKPTLPAYARSGTGGLYRGGVPQSIDFISYSPADNSIVVKDEPMREAERPQASGAQRLESIYAYPFGLVTMDRGDRLTRNLFQQESSLESLVKWEASWSDGDSVQSVIRLTNSSKTPWTSGPVFISKSNAPLAQVQMPFTAPGKFADLHLGRVQDVLVRKTETELRREPFKDPKNPTATLFTMDSEFKYSAENNREVDAIVEISTMIPGDILDNGGADVERLPIYQSVHNRFNGLKWRITLKPGEKKEVLVKARRID